MIVAIDRVDRNVEMSPDERQTLRDIRAWVVSKGATLFPATSPFISTGLDKVMGPKKPREGGDDSEDGGAGATNGVSV